MRPKHNDHSFARVTPRRAHRTGKRFLFYFFLNYNLMKTEMVAGGNSTNLLDACGRDGAAQDPPPSLFGKGFVQGLD